MTSIQEAWASMIEDAGVNWIERYTKEFPLRILFPQMRRMLKQVQAQKGRFRMLDRALLKERIQEFNKMTADHQNDLEDITAGKVWGYSAIAVALKMRVDTYMVVSTLDKVCCPVCQIIHGHVFSVAQAVQEMTEVLARLHSGEDIVVDFPRTDALIDLTKEEIRERAYTPPFHPACRCEIMLLGSSTTRETDTAHY